MFTTELKLTTLTLTTTQKNYLAVLTGDKSKVHGGSGRVLESTEQDDVFLTFFDHGSPGAIYFPNFVPLYADQLLGAINTMHTKKMYKKLVYYLEACESGSMFANLKKNIHVYAVTAANAHQSSWGAYCPPDDKVQDKHIGSCLGDLFSISWMEDTDVSDSKTETLEKQFEKVKKRTTRSVVSRFGDLSFTHMTTDNFLGVHNAKASIDREELEGSIVNSRDIRLRYLTYKHNRVNSEETNAELQAEIEMRIRMDKIFDAVQLLHDDIIPATDTDFDCYRNLNNFFVSVCGPLNEYNLKYLRSFYDVCAKKQEIVPQVKATLIEQCGVSF